MPLNIHTDDKKQPRAPTIAPTLLNAAATVTNDGKTLEWSHASNATNDLTLEEMKAIRPHSVRAARLVKALMYTKSLPAIVRHFNGVRGMGERTIRGVYAALQRARVGAK